MNTSIKGALENLDQCWMAFEHKGKRMTRSQVVAVLNYAKAKGYDTTDEIPDELVDKVLEDTGNRLVLTKREILRLWK